MGHLLGAPELDDRCRLLIRKNATESFEVALHALQMEGGASLKNMESAIRRIFTRMNASFLSQGFTLEFLSGAASSSENSVKRFLARFNAIFTLNQDLLLESGYCAQADPMEAFNHKWSGVSFPGMAPQHDPNFDPTCRKWCGKYHPNSGGLDLSTDRHSQPIYKMHGSANWMDGNGGRLLIMGGNKVETINGSSLLTAYANEFSRRLNFPDTRLMIIGYGFGDQHINAAIAAAAERNNIKIFIVDPKGFQAPFQHTSENTKIASSSPEGIIQANVVGFSCRGLSDIFGVNVAERDNIFDFMSR